MRWVSSAWPISSEKISTGRLRRLRHVGGDAQTEAGLAHCRPRPDDVERRGLQAGEDLVEIVEPGGRAGDDVAALEGLLQLVHRQRQQVAERADRGEVDAFLGDLEDLGLGFVERLGDVVGLEVGDLGDLAGDADQLAQHRRVLHDLGVARGVGDRRRRVLQFEQCLWPADLVEQTVAAQLVGDRDRVDRLTGGDQAADGRVDVLVARLVEVLDIDTELADEVDDIARQQQGTEQTLFGIEVVRWNATIGTARCAVTTGVAGEISHG